MRPMAEQTTPQTIPATDNGHGALEDMTHRAFLLRLIGSFKIRYPDEPIDYGALYEPANKARLRRIKEEEPDLYDGVFDPWVRAQYGLFLPTVEQRIWEEETPLALLRPSGPLPLAPPLLKEAQLDPELSEGASPWLDAYCEHSRKWSPRAVPAFH